MVLCVNVRHMIEREKTSMSLHFWFSILICKIYWIRIQTCEAFVGNEYAASSDHVNTF